MKAKFPHYLILIYTILSAITVSTVNARDYGSKKYGHEIIESLLHNGTLNLHSTQVNGAVDINGTLEIDQSKIGSINANGQVKLDTCIIKGLTTINGSLEAERTKFQNEVIICTKKLILRNCTLEALHVRKIEDHDGIQVLDLREGSQIHGPITFESGKGEIWISANSSISNKIVGATVLRK